MREETELTFIRCSSCRSLIPSVATKCRMCGAEIQSDEKGSLENAGVAENSAQTPRSESSEDLHSTESSEQLNSKKSAESFDGVLGSVEPLGSDKVEDSGSAIDPGFGESDSNLGIRNLFGPKESSSLEVDSILSKVTALPTEDSAENAPAPKRKRKRKKKKRLEDSFSAPEAIEQTDQSEDSAPVSLTSTQNISRLSAQPKSSFEKAEVNSEDQLMAIPSYPNAESDLVGWFVDYKNKIGSSIEIRSGRFFISGEQVKQSDFVLDEDSISSPHCLVKADPAEGIKVQDLMSESGTLVQKRGKGKFKKIEIPEALEHGDKIKLGGKELLVCVLPQAGSASTEE